MTRPLRTETRDLPPKPVSPLPPPASGHPPTAGRPSPLQQSCPVSPDAPVRPGSQESRELGEGHEAQSRKQNQGVQRTSEYQPVAQQGRTVISSRAGVGSHGQNRGPPAPGTPGAGRKEPRTATKCRSPVGPRASARSPRHSRHSPTPAPPPLSTRPTCWAVNGLVSTQHGAGQRTGGFQPGPESKSLRLSEQPVLALSF